MKRPSPMIETRGSGTDLDSAMTPMIDVVFLLLVFFVWTASFQIIEQILPSEMSSQLGSDPVDLAQPPPEADFDDIVVQIGWDGTNPNWTLNGQMVATIGALRDRLSILADIKSDAPVILDPASAVPLGYVIEVYDASKMAGLIKVSFAVNPEQN